MATLPFKRDSDGLLEHILHPRTEDRRVAWQDMIPSRYFYVRSEYETEIMTQQNVKRKWDIDVTKCEPKQLLVTLDGINYIAALRGIKAIRPQLHTCSPEAVYSTCEIEFIPNFEDPVGLTVGAQASATLNCVSGKFQLFLGPIAQNRAFVRACRQALHIEILGRDEFDEKASKAYEESLKKGESPVAESAKKPETSATGDSSSSEPIHTPSALLADRCKKLGITFEKIKARALEIKMKMASDPESAKIQRIHDDPSTWTGFDKISKLDCATLLQLIQVAQESKKK